MPVTRSGRRTQAEGGQPEAEEAPTVLQPAKTPATARKRSAKTSTATAAAAAAATEPEQPQGTGVQAQAIPERPQPSPRRAPPAKTTPPGQTAYGEIKEKASFDPDKSAYIQELKDKFKPPSEPLARAVRFIHTLWFQVDFILGAYVFDWWEVLMIYPLFLAIVVLVAIGLYRQSALALDLLKSFAQSVQAQYSTHST